MKKNILSLLLSILLFSCYHTKKTMHTNNIEAYVIRLKPGQDLRKYIEDFVKENNIKAGWITTCVGSLTNYNIRFANQKDGTTGAGYFEIVSLVGTVSTNGSHMHLSISDSLGRTIGGHLLQGNIIYTTAEIVIQNNPNLIFKREKDGSTPWEELQVETK